MVETMLLIHYIIIAILFFETIYVCFQQPSKMQVLILILLISSMIMIAGYSIELQASTQELALLGVAISYLGKPFALMTSVLFIANFCNRKISKTFIILWSCFNLAIAVLIFTNDYHFLYYSFVKYDPTLSYSCLILGKGPLYYAYMATIIASLFYTIIILILESKRTKTKIAKRQTLILFGMVACIAIGYAAYITKITNGYDSTIMGAVFGALCLLLLFTKYKFFDTTTLAKEHAIETSSTGFIIANLNNQNTYSNIFAQALMKDTFTTNELNDLPIGTSLVNKNNKIFEISKTYISKKNINYGVTIEINDVTIKFNYSNQLEKEVEERTKELQKIQRTIIGAFSGIIDARDESTGEHVERIKTITKMIAEELYRRGEFKDEINEKFITCLADVAPLHDIGKLAVPDNILLKPGRLTDEEFEIIKTHTTKGAEIIEQNLKGIENEEYVNMALDVALYHHEKWNGTGYPTKIRGKRIPLSARILAVADVYDAVRSKRCYKPQMKIDEACQVLIDGKGIHFDAVIVDAMLAIVDKIEKPPKLSKK